MARAEQVAREEILQRLSDTWKVLYRKDEQLLAPAGLSPVELCLLHMLSEKGPCPMAVLASGTVVTPSAITNSVDNLEARVLVARTRDAGDRRVVLVGITKEGEENLRKGLEIHRRFLARLTTALEDEDFERLGASLAKLSRAVEDLDQR